MNNTTPYSFKLVFYPLLVFTFFIQSCSKNTDGEQSYSAFEAELIDWQKARFERLKSESGWVNLAGLFWLDSTWKAMGYSKTSDFELVYGQGPETILLARVRKDSAIEYMIPDGLNVYLDSNLVSGGQVFSDDGHQFSFENLRWHFIERDGFHAIRLRDLDHPKLNELPPLKYYPASLEWVKQAQFEPYHPAPYVQVPNVLGRTTRMKVAGELSFEHEEKISKLILFDSGLGLGFLIFSDKTNGVSTYGGGRYMYLKIPTDGPGKVTIDFNRAYSPPCEFTDYATCAFPPSENILEFEVLAGEKSTFHE